MAAMPDGAVMTAMCTGAGASVAGAAMMLGRSRGCSGGGNDQGRGGDCQQAHALLLECGGMFPVRNETYAVKVRRATGDAVVSDG